MLHVVVNSDSQLFGKPRNLVFIQPIKKEDIKEFFISEVGWVRTQAGESVGLQVAAALWPPAFLLQTTPPPAASPDPRGPETQILDAPT